MLAARKGREALSGSSGHGFKLGPAIGEAVANFVTSGKAGLLAPFSLSRFRRLSPSTTMTIEEA
jgi:glycine/D-amino acid oxidase-like deaminating enzyme